MAHSTDNSWNDATAINDVNGDATASNNNDNFDDGGDFTSKHAGEAGGDDERGPIICRK